MANTKIDSIKLSGSTETYDLDLPSTATPNIAGLSTGYLTVTGSTSISGDPIYITGTNSVNITGSTISMSSQSKTEIHADTLLRLSANGRIQITASNSTSTANTLIAIGATNINFAPYSQAMFNLPSTTSTATRKSIIKLNTNEFIDNNSPCISLTNYTTDSTSVNGKIGITPTQGIGLLKIFDGSVGNNTYLTVDDSRVNMGIVDVSTNTLAATFATFSENSFNITLSQHLLDDGADPFMNITGTLSNFTLAFPSAQTDITIDEHNLTLNHITPKITTSQGNLIEYPGCGYTQSDDAYVIPSKADLKSGGPGLYSTGISALTASTLTRSSQTLSGEDYGTVYHIFGYETGETGENPGELRVTTSMYSSNDSYTVIVSDNDHSWHGDSHISLTAVVPAGKTYYLWGKNVGNLAYFKVYL